MTDRFETSGEIEREAEISRARLAQTLDQLRDNLTPQHLADEVLGNARRGASVVLRSVGESAIEHPVPALLIAAASAMLFSAAAGLTQSSSGSRSASFSTPALPTSTSYPAKTRSEAPESRGTALGERPVVTALLGVVIGRWLGTMFPAAERADRMREKLTAAAAECGAPPDVKRRPLTPGTRGGINPCRCPISRTRVSRPYRRDKYGAGDRNRCCSAATIPAPGTHARCLEHVVEGDERRGGAIVYTLAIPTGRVQFLSGPR
jgi:hypothetical protein